MGAEARLRLQIGGLADLGGLPSRSSRACSGRSGYAFAALKLRRTRSDLTAFRVAAPRVARQGEA